MELYNILTNIMLQCAKNIHSHKFKNRQKAFIHINLKVRKEHSFTQISNYNGVVDRFVSVVMFGDLAFFLLAFFNIY